MIMDLACNTFMERFLTTLDSPFLRYFFLKLRPESKVTVTLNDTFREEGHRALGREATFSWSRALTHPPRCNRTRHREVGDLMAAILDRKS